MRDYATVSPQFWVGDTGRKLRVAGLDAQVVALYLVSSPSSNMIGLYYLPIPTLSHETGIPLEGASKALRRVCDTGFALYDEDQEVVWVVEMARYQVGEKLSPKDMRVKGVARELGQYRKSPFYRKFLDRYGEAFCLGSVPEEDPPNKGPRRPFEGPSNPPRSQDQDQEQDQDQDQDQERGRASSVLNLSPSPSAEQLLDQVKREYSTLRGDPWDASSAALKRDLKAIAACLEKASGDIDEVLVRWRTALVHTKWPRINSLPELVQHWVHFGNPPEVAARRLRHLNAGGGA